jgi:hypothetical protein
MTADKDRDCIKRTGFPCVRLPRSLYERAVAEGHDMKNYVVQEMMPPTSACVQYDGALYRIEHRMPTSKQMRDATMARLNAGLPLGASHNATIKSEVFVNGSIEPPDHLRYAAMKKHISEKYCGGMTCMPGLGGTCVACSEDD